MKKVLLIIFSISIFLACNKPQESVIADDNFQIHFKTNFKPIGVVKLYEIIAGNQKFIDSIYLDGTSDTFSFKSKQSVASFYSIETAKTRECLVAVDAKEALHITIDGSLQMPVFTTSSTKINDYYYKVESMKNKFNVLVDSMNQAYIIAQNTADKATVDNLEMSIDTLTAVLYYNLKKEFYTQPLSIVSIYTANIMGYESEPQLNDSLATALLPLVDKSLYIKNYVESINKLTHLKVGSMAPAFTQATNDGRTIGLKDYKDKLVLLDFWASWCIPCRRANPKLVSTYNKYKNKGFSILSISLDEDLNKWKDAIKTDGLVWDHVSDLKGWDNEVAKIYNVQEIPAAFLVNDEGQIVATGFNAEELEGLLEKNLKK